MLPLCLQTIDLSKRLGKTLVLDQLNMRVTEGSIYALLGPNGAGKSTTLEILMNLQQPSSGRAEIFDHDSRQLSPHDLTQIGYVAENQDLPDWMTIAEFMAYLAPFYPNWDAGFASQMLRSFDLPPDRQLRHLSRGMRMKVSLASSLAYRPRLLVMDEPFSSLDTLTRDELIDSLLANTKGSSMLISSHDLGEVEAFATHIGYLDHGRLQFSESSHSLGERFREIEITVNHRSSVTRAPSSWMNVEYTNGLVRLIETQFDRERTMADIGRLFPEAKHVQVSPLRLRAIFNTLAKASRHTEL